MRTRCSIVLLSASLALAAGCAGDSARVRALAPAVKTAWEDGTREDAALGLKVRETPAAAAALGVETWSAPVVDIRREKHAKLDEAIQKLQPVEQP